MEIRTLTPAARPRWMKVGGAAARVILAGVFIFAGAVKILDPGQFATEIRRFNLLPWLPAAILALYLPWLELLAGFSLFLKKLQKGALLLIVILLAIFSVALLSAMIRGLNIDCGCFGKVFTSTGTTIPLVRNLFLLFLAGFLWRQNR